MGIISLVLLVVLAVGAILAIVATLGSLGSLRLGQVTLTCPHCGEQTDTTSGKCVKCGEDL